MLSAQPGVLVPTYSPSTPESEAEGWPGVQGQPRLQSKSKASVNYIARPCLKQMNDLCLILSTTKNQLFQKSSRSASPLNSSLPGQKGYGDYSASFIS